MSGPARASPPAASRNAGSSVETPALGAVCAGIEAAPIHNAAARAALKRLGLFEHEARIALHVARLGVEVENLEALKEVAGPAKVA